MTTSLEERYQRLIQKRIDLECKIASSFIYRDNGDVAKLNKLNAKIKEIEDQMFSAEASSTSTAELPSEHIAQATKIFH